MKANTKKRRRKGRKKSGSSLGKWWGKQRRQLKRLSIWMIAIAAILFAIHHFYPDFLGSLFPSTRSAASSSDYDGIDISKYQGKINWKKVKANSKIKFVYIKATEGASLLDKKYKSNLKGARDAGIPVGSYHFFTSHRSAKDQFANFKRHVPKNKQDLLPMVDVEEDGVRGCSRAKLQKSLDEFMQLVKKEYGKYPLLYCPLDFYNKMLAPEFNKYYIFIARYGKSAPRLHGPGKHNIWQYSEKGRIDGIPNLVDLDKFENGTSVRDIML
ncbi:MAG: glycosyl hydrolase family 25 [Prevotella sp.]|nr:glycosyl hydrolase family 25 [Prevotella sp.]MBR7055191.1 glycosyl hydrolase family 25 [Prevotella sp.]